MIRYPDGLRSQHPHIRLGDFNPCTRRVVFVRSDFYRPDWCFVNRSLPFLEFCRWGKVYSFLPLIPRHQTALEECLTGTFSRTVNAILIQSVRFAKELFTATRTFARFFLDLAFFGAKNALTDAKPVSVNHKLFAASVAYVVNHTTIIRPQPRLDNGSGRTGIEAIRLGLDFIGCELSPDYAEMSRRLLKEESPLFT